MHDPQLVHVIHDQHHGPEVICTCGAHVTFKAKYAHTTMAPSTYNLPPEGAEEKRFQGHLHRTIFMPVRSNIRDSRI